MRFRALASPPLAACIAAWGAVALASIFLHGPLPLYSTRTLAVAWEMWDRGSWWVPLFNGAPYSHKTPLLPWLIHAGWAVSGVGDGWPRVLMVLLGMLALWQAGTLARRLLPGVRHADAMAACVLGAFAYLFLFSLQLMYELLLTCCVLGALLALCRRAGDAWTPRWPAFALALGLGLLAKGPVMLVHLGLPLLAARAWHPAARADGRRFARQAVLATLAGSALFCGWLVPVLLHGDPGYRDALLFGQTTGRMVDSFDHAEPWWWYAPVLPMLLLPWLASWRDLRALRRLPRDPGLSPQWRLLPLWGFGALAVFSAISGKQPYYLLPELPAFAIALALALASRAGDRRDDAPRRSVGIALWWLLVAAVLGIGLQRLSAGDARFAQFDLFPAWALAIPLLAGIALLLRRLAAWPRIASASLASLLAVAGLHAAATPALWPRYDLAPTARVLAREEAAGRRIAHLGDYQLQYHFAGRLHRPIEKLDYDGAVAWAAAHPDGVLIVNTQEAWPDAALPLVQQPFRRRWIQAWRARDWLPRRPPPPSPAQARTGEVGGEPL